MHNIYHKFSTRLSVSGGKNIMNSCVKVITDFEFQWATQESYNKSGKNLFVKTK